MMNIFKFSGLMGIQKGLTHAPKEMANLKDITLNKKFLNGIGSLKKIDDFKKVYIQDLIKKNILLKDINLLCDKNVFDNEIFVKIRSTGKLIKSKLNSLVFSKNK